MITDRLDVPVEAFERETGWALKPEGACKGDLCVPMTGAVHDGVVDITAASDRLGMPVVHDEARGLYSLGPESLSGHALVSADAPEIVLPTIDGEEFRLSSLRGSKVLLVAWAPY